MIEIDPITNIDWRREVSLASDYHVRSIARQATVQPRFTLTLDQTSNRRATFLSRMMPHLLLPTLFQIRRVIVWISLMHI